MSTREHPEGEVDSWWDEPSPSSRRWDRLGWLAVVGVSILIFELTSDSSAAIAVGCLKFAWHDFATARRIRKSDADPTRGWVVAWFYRGWGLLKVSLIAITLIGILLGLGASLGRMRGQEFASRMKAAGWLALISFGSSLICTRVGLGVAMGRPIKIWVGGRRNRAPFLLFSNVMTGAAICSVILWFILPPILGKLDASEFRILAYRLIGILACFVSFFALWRHLLGTVVARSRVEC